MMLKLIDDHDPNPLHHYFTKNHESEFQWEYEQEGLVDWIVKIESV